jgi:hypothetical protein
MVRSVIEGGLENVAVPRHFNTTASLSPSGSDASALKGG